MAVLTEDNYLEFAFALFFLFGNNPAQFDVESEVVVDTPDTLAFAVSSIPVFVPFAFVVTFPVLTLVVEFFLDAELSYHSMYPLLPE